MLRVALAVVEVIPAAEVAGWAAELRFLPLAVEEESEILEAAGTAAA